MKNVMFVLLCLTAVKSFSQIKFGIQGGYDLVNYKAVNSANASARTTTSSINSFNASFISEIQISQQIFLQPALGYVGAGTQKYQTYNALGSSSNTRLKAYYARLPLNVVYKINCSNALKVFAGTGLYVAKGINGTEKGTGVGGDLTYFEYPINNKIVFSNDESDAKTNTTIVKPFDVGYNFVAGLQWKRFQLTANYSHGFSRVFSSDNWSFRNQEFAVSFGYYFMDKK
jgi:hypothetical protein